MRAMLSTSCPAIVCVLPLKLLSNSLHPNEA